MTFKLGLLEKDVRIGASVVRSAGLRAPVSDLVARVLLEAKVELGAGADYLTLVKLADR